MAHIARWRVGKATAPLIALLAIAAPATADAAQRYASTTGGTTEPCAAIDPCDIQTAFTGSSPNDEIIVNEGTYALGSNPLSAFHANLSIHGAAGQAKPVITGNPNNLFQVAGPGSSVADLIIDQFGSGTGAGFSISGAGSIAERIEVRSTADRACQVDSGALLRDSICVYNGTAFNSAGLFTGGGTATSAAQNVTAIGNGVNSDGIRLLASSGASPVFNARNVIAIGSNDDIEVATPAGSTGTIDLAFSNWDEPANINGTGTGSATPVGSPTNQTAAPVFVDAAGGDYRQALGSPTINAGAADGATGLLDFERDPRSQGASVDIGADEYTPAVTPPPADVTPPETTIDRGPRKQAKSKRAKFRFSADEAGSTFRCKLDKAPFSACSSPLKLKRLKRAKHTFTVVATDAAGNADASPAVYKWKIKKPKAGKR